MEYLDIGLLRGLLTVLLMAAFLGLCVWAFSRRRKADFDEAARLPLEDDAGAPPAPDNGGRRQ